MSGKHTETRGGVDFELLCRGNTKAYYSFNLTDLRGKKVKYMKRKLIRQLKKTIRKLELYSKRKITKIYVGKTYIRCKKPRSQRSMFNPLDHNTWIKQGIGKRWNHHKRQNYGKDGMVILCAVTQEMIPQKIWGRFCKNQFALALESMILHHYCLFHPDKRFVNKTFTAGRVPKQEPDAYVIYIAFSYADIDVLNEDVHMQGKTTAVPMEKANSFPSGLISVTRQQDPNSEKATISDSKNSSPLRASLSQMCKRKRKQDTIPGDSDFSNSCPSQKRMKPSSEIRQKYVHPSLAKQRTADLTRVSQKTNSSIQSSVALPSLRPMSLPSTTSDTNTESSQIPKLHTSSENNILSQNSILCSQKRNKHTTTDWNGYTIPKLSEHKTKHTNNFSWVSDASSEDVHMQGKTTAVPMKQANSFSSGLERQQDHNPERATISVSKNTSPAIDSSSHMCERKRKQDATPDDSKLSQTSPLQKRMKPSSETTQKHVPPLPAKQCPTCVSQKANSGIQGSVVLHPSLCPMSIPSPTSDTSTESNRTPKLHLPSENNTPSQNKRSTTDWNGYKIPRHSDIVKHKTKHANTFTCLDCKAPKNDACNTSQPQIHHKNHHQSHLNLNLSSRNAKTARTIPQQEPHSTPSLQPKQLTNRVSSIMVPPHKPNQHFPQTNKHQTHPIRKTCTSNTGLHSGLKTQTITSSDTNSDIITPSTLTSYDAKTARTLSLQVPHSASQPPSLQPTKLTKRVPSTMVPPHKPNKHFPCANKHQTHSIRKTCTSNTGVHSGLKTRKTPEITSDTNTPRTLTSYDGKTAKTLSLQEPHSASQTPSLQPKKPTNRVPSTMVPPHKPNQHFPCANKHQTHPIRKTCTSNTGLHSGLKIGKMSKITSCTTSSDTKTPSTQENRATLEAKLRSLRKPSSGIESFSQQNGHCTKHYGLTLDPLKSKTESYDGKQVQDLMLQSRKNLQKTDQHTTQTDWLKIFKIPKRRTTPTDQVA